MTERFTGTVNRWNPDPRLLSLADLINAGVALDGIPEDHNPENIYVSASPELIDELRQRIESRGHQLTDHGIMVQDIYITRHEADE